MKNIRVTHFLASAYRVMPWKNGKGSTTELCISPPQGSVQDEFDWRISVARVPESGPFSKYLQHERMIMLLRGEPMHLMHEGRGQHTLHPFQPYAFHGAWHTTGLVSGDAVEDFNVMLREGLGRANIKVYQDTGNKGLKHPSASVQFVWAFEGTAEIVIDKKVYPLLEQESCLIENGPELLLRMTSTPSLLIAVNISFTPR